MTSRLLRAICHYRLPQMWATDEELADATGLNLPRIIRLDEWEHPDIADAELSSESPAFRMLADVLAAGDVELYDLQQVSPNTNWRNWPDAGTL